ncbi:MAG: Xaa-Pro peptidase family protein [Hyphomonadaceae bacterium]|jgi:Xaa-Pro aminopeptidase|nr:Xaa-Pro peptidase family protein [Hyphomonadaceae bacterium]
MVSSEAAIRKPLPFDAARLDRLLDEAGIDVLLATSKHNVQYLLGGYRFFFFDIMDAIGISRYLPILVYRKGKLDAAAYVGCAMENFERELGKFWPPTLSLGDTGSVAAMRQAVAHIKKLGNGIRRIGVELAFLPADAEAALRQGLPNVDIVDAVLPLERLRARKTPEEAACLREASNRVVAAMLATFRQCKPGAAKQEIAETLRREEVNRGLVFDYCLLTAGSSLNRAPSEQRLAAGDILSLDSGGNYKGYIGDLCRMGILGKPDAELQDLLGFVDEVQQATRKPIKAGARGGDIIALGEKMVAGSPHARYAHYVAHGMGLVSHEAPRLMNISRLSYTASDADRPLEAGMVISIETTIAHPKRGFVKLEDTVLVTSDGHEALGDGGRGWNRIGD